MSLVFLKVACPVRELLLMMSYGFSQMPQSFELHMEDVMMQSYYRQRIAASNEILYKILSITAL
jgi:hypothetical protein